MVPPVVEKVPLMTKGAEYVQVAASLVVKLIVTVVPLLVRVTPPVEEGFV